MSAKSTKEPVQNKWDTRNHIRKTLENLGGKNGHVRVGVAHESSVVANNINLLGISLV